MLISCTGGTGATAWPARKRARRADLAWLAGGLDKADYRVVEFPRLLDVGEVTGVIDYGELGAGNFRGELTRHLRRGQPVGAADHNMRGHANLAELRHVIGHHGRLDALDVALLVQPAHAVDQLVEGLLRRIRSDQRLGDRNGDVLGLAAI